MSLPDTKAYRLQLEALRALSPACAELGERIGNALRSEVLIQTTATLAGDMLTHLSAVGLQRADSVARLGVWLYGMVVLRALSHTEATTFLANASALCGPSAVVPA